MKKKVFSVLLTVALATGVLRGIRRHHRDPFLLRYRNDRCGEPFCH